MGGGRGVYGGGGKSPDAGRGQDPRLRRADPAHAAVDGGALPQFWCNLAVGWRNLHESREPLCDCFAWSFAVCGDFFEVAVWSFGIRSFRQHTLPSPSSVQRPTPHVLRAAASPAAGT